MTQFPQQYYVLSFICAVLYMILIVWGSIDKKNNLLFTILAHLIPFPIYFYVRVYLMWEVDGIIAILIFLTCVTISIAMAYGSDLKGAYENMPLYPQGSKIKALLQTLSMPNMGDVRKKTESYGWSVPSVPFPKKEKRSAPTPVQYGIPRGTPTPQNTATKKDTVSW